MTVKSAIEIRCLTRRFANGTTTRISRSSEYRGSFRDRVDITGEVELREIIDQRCVNLSGPREPDQFVFAEPKRFKDVACPAADKPAAS